MNLTFILNTRYKTNYQIQLKMAHLQNLSIYLFNSIITELSVSEKNILNSINISNKYMIDNFNKMVKENIENIINNLLNNNLIKNKIPNTPNIKDNGLKIKNKKGRNSELNEYKKYCNRKRTRNRGYCRNIIYISEDSCKLHKKVIDNNIIMESEENTNNTFSQKVRFNDKNEIIEIEKEKKVIIK